MRSSFSFFQNKLKSVDNYQLKRNVGNDQSMLNSFENSSRLENKLLKKKPLIDKEKSTLSYLKPNLKKINSLTKPKHDSFIKVSSFKKNAKKRSVGNLFLDNQKRKSNQNPSLLLKMPTYNKKSIKKVHFSSNNCSFIFSNFKRENNEFSNLLNAVNVKKNRFLELKTPKGIRHSINMYNFKTSGDKRPESSKAIVESRFNYYNNNAKMFKINQKIQNEIESRQLKKKLIL